MKINEGLTYFPKSKRLCPSHWFCIVITHLIIVPPTFLALYCTAISAFLPIWLKVIFVIINVVTMCASLRNLFKAAFTEPGIIPPLAPIKSGEYTIDPEKAYYAKYMDKEALDTIKDELGDAEA